MGMCLALLILMLCLGSGVASAASHYGCPAEPTWNAVPCSMHAALQPENGLEYSLTHVLSWRGGEREVYIAVSGESAVTIHIWPHFADDDWVARRVAAAWASQPAILRRSVMPLIVAIDSGLSGGPVYWDYRETVEAAHVVDFPADYVHEDAGTLDWAFEELLTHELCHALDGVHGLREREGWKDAARSDGSYVSDYARSSAEEDFAESCAAYVLLRTSPRLDDRHRRHVEDTMPKRMEWLGELFGLGPFIATIPD